MTRSLQRCNLYDSLMFKTEDLMNNLVLLTCKGCQCHQARISNENMQQKYH